MNKLRFALAGLGVAALILAACSGSGNDDDFDGSMGEGAGSSADMAGAAESSGASDGERAGIADDSAGSVAAPQGEEASSQIADRKVIRNADIEMDADDVSGAFREVQAQTRSMGGYVESSRLEYEDGDDERGKHPSYASVTVRVPAERYDDFLNAVRGMPATEVTAEHSDSQNVTEQYTDLQSQLRNLQRIESQYLALLDKAVSIDDILTVSDRLDSVRAQIEQTQGRINLLDNLADMATITMTITPALPGSSGDGGDRSPASVFADAWQKSLDAAESVLYAAIVLGVVAIWLVPVVVVGGLVWLGWRRRDRGTRPGGAADAAG